MLVTEGKANWWSPDREEPSRGGRFERGRVTIIEVESGEVRHAAVHAEVAVGFSPPEEREERYELLGRPEFTSPTEIVLRPEFGGEHTLTLAARWTRTSS